MIFFVFSFKFFFHLFIYFDCTGSFFPAHGFSLVAVKRGQFLVVVLRLLIVVDSVAAEHGL